MGHRQGNELPDGVAAVAGQHDEARVEGPEPKRLRRKGRVLKRQVRVDSREELPVAVMELEEVDISALSEAGWQPPDIFVAKSADGETDQWGSGPYTHRGPAPY